MAQKFTPIEDRFYRGGITYGDPIAESLRVFSRYLDGDDASNTRESFHKSVFFQNRMPVRCFYDLVYVWLVEGDAVVACPTFESWLVFLIAFADEVRRFREGNVVLNRLQFEYITHPSIAPISNLDKLDLFNWGEGADHDRIEPGFLQLSEEGFGHPVLRRDVWERARSLYRQRD